MTRKELNVFLKSHMVPQKFYSLNGNHKNRICLEQTGSSWQVYFSDKKEKVGLLQYATESEACLRMKEEVKKLMELCYGLTWAKA